MANDNDDEKTKKYVDFITDDEDQEFDLLNRAEVDESAVDFDPAAVRSIELSPVDSEENTESLITGPRTFLADELGIERQEPLVKKQKATTTDEEPTKSNTVETFARSSSGVSVKTDSKVGSKIDFDSSFRGEQDADFSYSEFVDILQNATATKAKPDVAVARKINKSEEPTEEIVWDKDALNDTSSSEKEASEDVQADYATSKVVIKDPKTKTKIDAVVDSDEGVEEKQEPIQEEEVEPLTKTSLRMGSDHFREEATDRISKKKVDQALAADQKPNEEAFTNSPKQKEEVEEVSDTQVSQESIAESVLQEQSSSSPAKEASVNHLSDDFQLLHKAMEPTNLAPASLSSQPNLQSNESLRLAQDKILDLESELEKLRIENQELAAAGEVLKRKLNEQDSTRIKLDKTKQEVEQQLKEEVEHSQLRIQAKNQEIAELKVKVESLELRLQRDLQRVRSRERELENRLEIVRLENSAVLRSKDEHILDLKRKLDQKDLEAEQLSERLKNQIDESKEKQDKIKRTIRTLRLALNMLDEAEDDIKMKKTG